MSDARTLAQRGAMWATAALVAACGSTVARVPTTPDDARRRVGVIADEYGAAHKAMFPGADYFRQTLAGGDALPDNSLAALAAWQRREDAWMSQLHGLDPEALWGTPEWTAFGYLRTALETSIATRTCRPELWPAHQYGWQVSLLEMLDLQPVGTKEARAQALARWSQLPRFLEIELANLREGLRRGFSAPKPNVELAVAQLEALLAAKLTESQFWSPAQRDPDESFRQQWQSLIEAQLVPATRRYLAYLRDEYWSRARSFRSGRKRSPSGRRKPWRWCTTSSAPTYPI